jgi:hypothetical protein
VTQWLPFEALVWGFVAVAFVSANLPGSVIASA